MNNQKKVVVITGASQGIGAGLVRAFLARDYNVVANARSMIASAQVDVHVVSGDISDPETAERIIREGLERFGRIDTLINNAGVFVSKPFVEFTKEDYDYNMSVNVAGFFYLTQRAATQMLQQRSGHIVNITTSLVDQPDSRVRAALASLTKGGLSSVTKALAIEFAQAGVRVNAVSPGVINTPMHPVETHAALGAMHPLGRMGEISDIVEAILYLETATFVTGEILHVDGGQNAGHACR